MSEGSETDWEAGRAGLALSLIRAGRNERASASARRVALGAFAAASAPAAAQAASWLTMLKWLGLSAVVVSGAGLAWHASTRPVESAASPAPVSSSARPGSGPKASAQAGVVASIAGVTPTPSIPVAAESRREPSVASGARPRASSEPPRDERLRRELDALRSARAALAAGSAAKALALLDGLAGGFRLLPLEAGIVRVEALHAAGDASAARRLAARLLEQPGSGPYTERLRALARD